MNRANWQRAGTGHGGGSSQQADSEYSLELVRSCAVSYVLALDAGGLRVDHQEHQYESRAGSDFAGVAFRCLDGMIA
jgi:hypothetical protein